jgi:serine phosphatase RsbU (regulator of sigma subunit)
MGDWEEHAQAWRMMPVGSSALFFAGVFCLFGALTLIISGRNLQSQSLPELFGTACVGGTIAVVWACAGTRRIFWMFFLAALLQVLLPNVLDRLSGSHHTLGVEELQRKVQLNGLAEILLIIAGYALLVYFFTREGTRFFRTQTEVRLAGEIHRKLVPARHETIAGVEIFGASIASSEVGGDLFDILKTDGGWHSYVADVSGHGVAAGLLMSMIKSTVAMQLTKLKKPHDLLTDLNDVMQPFTSPANYLTFAYVGGNGTDHLDFALGGHLPILHYQAQSKTILEHSDANIPIGLFPGQSFTISQLTLLPGDLLAIITDGFTEVFDAQEQEIGLEKFKSLLLGCAEKPLPSVYQDLLSATRRFGEQSDDQTMLLIRRMP